MIAAYLTHRVALVRRAALVQGGEPVLDEDGHVQHSEQRTSGIAAAIQPLTTRERAAQHQAGMTVSTHRIYAGVDVAISTADRIDHDPDACPLSPDLPAASYELNGVQNAAGLSHHLEIDATEVGPSFTPAPPSSPGSGSGS